jgi:hypothetical protein
LSAHFFSFLAFGVALLPVFVTETFFALTNQDSIVNLQTQIGESKKELTNVEDAILKGKNYRDDMLKKKHTNIDHEISLLNPTKTQEEINEIDFEKKGYISKIKELKVVEPSEYYHED